MVQEQDGRSEGDDLLKLSLYELMVLQLRHDKMDKAIEAVNETWPLPHFPIAGAFQGRDDVPPQSTGGGPLFELYKQLLSSPLLPPRSDDTPGALSPGELLSIARNLAALRHENGAENHAPPRESSTGRDSMTANESGIPWSPVGASWPTHPFAPSPASETVAVELFNSTHRIACSCVATNATGSLVVSGGHDLTVRVTTANALSADPFKERFEDSLVVKTDQIGDWLSTPTALALHPTRDLVFVGCHDGTIVASPTSSTEQGGSALQFSVRDTRRIQALSVHPYGEHLFVGALHNVVRLYDIATRECFSTLQNRHQHSDFVNDLAVSKDGKILTSCSSDGSIKLWDALSNRIINTIPSAHRGSAVSSVRFGSSPWLMASAGLDGCARLWDLRSGGELQVFPSTFRSGVAFAKTTLVGADDSVLALTVAGVDGQSFEDLTLFDCLGGGKLQTLDRHRRTVTALEAIGDSRMIATASMDGKCRVLEINRS